MNKVLTVFEALRRKREELPTPARPHDPDRRTNPAITQLYQNHNEPPRTEPHVRRYQQVEPTIAIPLTPPPPAVTSAPAPRASRVAPPPPRRFDFLELMEAVSMRWPIILFGCASLMLVGGVVGQRFWQTRYSVQTQLIRRTSASGAGYERQVLGETLARILRAPELLQRVSQLSQSPITPDRLVEIVSITPDRQNEIITLTVTGDDADSVVNLANLYANEAVTLTRRLQEVVQVEKEERTARDELVALRTRYTDAHPLVQEQRARLEAIDRMAAAPAPVDGQDKEFVRDVVRSVQGATANADNTEKLVTDILSSSYRVFSPARTRDVSVKDRRPMIALSALFGGLLGFAIFVPLMALNEITDNRLKTRSDVARVTGLPILASVSRVSRHDATRRSGQAFQMWKTIEGQLERTPGEGIICGVIGSSSPEERSTFIRFLAEGAAQGNAKVITIDLVTAETGHDADTEMPSPIGHRQTEPDKYRSITHGAWALSPVSRFAEALTAMRKMENLVLLVRLPSPTIPDVVLAAEKLPNLLWLAHCGREDAGDTRAHIEALRAGDCRLVGAVLNHEPRPLLRLRIPRWLPCLMLALSLGSAAFGEATRAAWQEHLTLGPGDVVNFAVYGHPDLTRKEMFVGPDGRLSYLEAHDVLVRGLTIDEARAKFDQELGKYRRAVRTIITPVAFHSKKYFVLGKVTQPGVFTLDRPTTVLEAVARTHGLETGFFNGSNTELADLSRSLLVRQGSRQTVDFEKLFHRGDLTQNVSLEPGDYLFFAAAEWNAVYVLGEVQQPGALSYTPDLSPLAAIAGRGGFSQRAWMRRVLVVRGSLNHPVTFAVDMADVLAGKGKGFQLQPKDIVYVNHRPWIKAEELLDTAISAFIEAAVITYTGRNIGPFIK